MTQRLLATTLSLEPCVGRTWFQNALKIRSKINFKSPSGAPHKSRYSGSYVEFGFVCGQLLCSSGVVRTLREGLLLLKMWMLPSSELPFLAGGSLPILQEGSFSYFRVLSGTMTSSEGRSWGP